MKRNRDLGRFRQAVRKGPLGPNLPGFTERLGLRKSAGLSRREVADVLGVSERAVWLWETCRDPRNSGLPRAYRRLLQAFRAEAGIVEGQA